jgi:hypothetical protein
VRKYSACDDSATIDADVEAIRLAATMTWFGSGVLGYQKMESLYGGQAVAFRSFRSGVRILQKRYHLYKQSLAMNGGFRM